MALPASRRQNVESARRSEVLLFNKPYGVLCQFSGASHRPTLKDFIPLPDFYPAGRLDADSEGLVVLTADGRVQAAIADPRHKLEKTYWVQVEGTPTSEALARLRSGVILVDGPTLPARARLLDEPPTIWARIPPVRVRRAIPTHWLEIALREGRNRQIRRMTASVGLPTLRLLRCAVGPWRITGLEPGSWRREPCDITVLSSPATR